MINAQKIAKMRRMLATATPSSDVHVIWYPERLRDGTMIKHPQFETEIGGIAQADADYELYCAARNMLPELLDIIEKLRSKSK